jgi:sugar phosphate isomerase/epimerase
MEFGICTSLSQADAAKAAGWDYVEPPAKELLDGVERRWPARAVNVLVPPSLKITGPHVDPAALRDRLRRVAERARAIGVEILVFGSGGARNVPDGFDRATADEQIIDFARMAADVAKGNGVLVAIEPLNRGECNIVHTLAEAAAIARRIDHPNLRVLLDSYHLWLENEPLENVAAAMDLIAHVHVADKDGRVAPGESGTSDYRSLFRILKSGGYDSRMSVEASRFDIGGRGADVLSFLKQQWKDC